LDEQGIEHDFRKPLSNKKVVKLKPHQEKYLDIWANYWIDIGLCTRSTDEVKAKQYFSDLYKELGLKKPKSIVWCNNPIEMCNQIDLNNQTSSQILNRLRYLAQVNQVYNMASDYVNDQTYSQIWCKVWRQVSYQVWHQVSYQLINQVFDQVWNQVFYKQQTVYWLAYYSYYMQILRIEIDKLFIPLILLSQEVNCWIPTEKIVYVTKKPKECIVENGKFVKLIYQDGYTIT
jgi:hypothetical protein